MSRIFWRTCWSLYLLVFLCLTSQSATPFFPSRSFRQQNKVAQKCSFLFCFLKWLGVNTLLQTRQKYFEQSVIKWRFLTGVTRYRNGSYQWSEPFGHGYAYISGPSGPSPKPFGVVNSFGSRVRTMPKWFGSLTTAIPVPDKNRHLNLYEI